MRKKKLFKYLSILSVIGLLTYCSKVSKPQEIIQIVTAADYRPFSFKNEHGEMTGFDIELIKIIMQHLKLEYSIEELTFDEVLSAIEGARADIAIAAIAITPEREEKFEFTTPYLQSPQALLMSIDNPAVDFHELHPKTVLVQKSASHPNILEKLISHYPNSSIVELKDIHHVIEEFKSNADAHTVILLDQAVAISLFEEMPELKVKVLGMQDEGLNFAIALPKKSELRRKINKVLQQLKNDGTLESLKKKYKVE